ncbi:AAEL017496-PA [Aedes aegypti]|uniref:AAEL017496-PA n=1 Tax=Aedes aegypti TaxID=7159 RepID=J9HZH0_AEDAE|nr:AAEL017496-PA [Aedes aegypti]
MVFLPVPAWVASDGFVLDVVTAFKRSCHGMEWNLLVDSVRVEDCSSDLQRWRMDSVTTALYSPFITNGS